MDRQAAHGSVRLRPALAIDRELLLSIYASTRAEELAQTAWTAEERTAFIRTQFDAQDRYQRTRFPNAAHSMILLDGQSVGRICVDRPGQEIRVVDIALLIHARGRGIATELVGDLVAEADEAGIPVRLHADADGRARALYERLGFRRIDDVGDRVLLERPVGGVDGRDDGSPLPGDDAGPG